MEIKEAIAELRNMQKFNYTLAPNEVFTMAISALEKQDGKKPTHEATIYRSFNCPYCKNVVDHFEEFIPKVKTRIMYQYCHFCGQKIDWSDMMEVNKND